VARPLRLAGLSLFAVVCASISPARAQCQDAHGQDDPAYPALQQAVDAYLAQRQGVEHLTGISMHISRSATGPDLDIETGRTGLQTAQPICPDTWFQIGSITKSFTSVMILQLEAQGILDIHDTLGKWLPQYPAWSSFTIQQLLNMTTTIDDYTNDPTFQSDEVADLQRTWKLPQVVSYVYPGSSEPKPPWFYSNTDYTLAGMIIAKATHMSYARALKNLLLDPFRLHETYYRPEVPPQRLLDVMARGYFFADLCAGQPSPCAESPVEALYGTDITDSSLSIANANGGIIATPRDISRWARLLSSGDLLPAQQQAELFSLVSRKTGQPIPVTSPADPAGFSLGIGQNWFPPTASPLWLYKGDTIGYRFAWFRRDGDDLIVTIAMNSQSDPEDKFSFWENFTRVFRAAYFLNSELKPNSAPFRI
jgi:D-alanyl-D-alanine carboxypeptidase